MSTVTDNDLRELKDLITQLSDRIETRFNEVDRKIEKLTDDVNEVKVEIASIKGNQEGFSKRIDNLEFTNRGIFISIVGGSLIAIITLIVKFLAPTINF
jgi:murein lipoprotein